MSMNLYQRAQNQTFSLFCSTDLVDLKILLSVRQEYFGPYFRNQNFPKYEICPSTQ